MITAHTPMTSTDPSVRQALRKMAPRVLSRRWRLLDDTPRIGERRKFMTQKVPTHYIKAITEFGILLAQTKNQQLADQGIVDRTYVVEHDPQRKFDRIRLVEVTSLQMLNNMTSATHSNSSNPSTLLYFVERETGAIYGIKSQVSPNTKWYYGTIYNCHKWNWSGKHPLPVKDTSVEQVGQYADHPHYVPVKK